jgi:hypothetical protein
MGTPPYQRLTALPQRNPGVCTIEAHDRRALAKLVRRGFIRVESIARGIRGLDIGKKGFIERLFWFANLDILRRLRSDANPSIVGAVPAAIAGGNRGPKPKRSVGLWPGGAFFGARFDEQADAGDMAVRHAAP